MNERAAIVTGASRGIGYALAKVLAEAGYGVTLSARKPESLEQAAEALRAATVGGARALRRDDLGQVRVGARADLAVIDAPSFLHLPYRVGVPLVRALEV